MGLWGFGRFNEVLSVGRAVMLRAVASASLDTELTGGDGGSIVVLKSWGCFEKLS